MGDIPSHWEVKALKYCADLISERVDGATSASSYVGLEHIESHKGRLHRLEGSQETAESAVSRFSAGDVLFGKLRPYLAKAAVADMDGVCSSEILVYRPHAIEPGYLKHVMLLGGFIEEVNASTYGSKMPRADAAFISRLPIPQPSREEQLAIEAYLDAETARIDALLETKNQLVRLLHEYREATVFELLQGTKRSSVIMKSSGLGWLPAVPDHWDVCGLGKRYEVQLGKMLDAKQITGEHLHPYLRNQDVQWRHINIDNLPLMDFDVDDRERFSLRFGDVLVCEGGEVGRAAIWRSDFECYYQKALHRLRPLTDLDVPEFVILLLETAVKRGVFTIAEKSTIAHLPADQLRQHRFPFPPRDEQLAIVLESQRVSNQVNELIEHVVAEIAALGELRASTITDAVLGRIDVRNHAKH